MDLSACLQCMKGRQMNCAETVLYALNEEYDLGVTPDELHTMAGFGGGICGDMCGALCGSLAALGKYHVYNNSHKTVGFSDSCREFVELFDRELGGKTCSVLKEKYRTEEKGCVDTVMLAKACFRRYLEIESRERPQYVILGDPVRAIRRGIELHLENEKAQTLILVPGKTVSLEGTGCADLDELRNAHGIEVRVENEIIGKPDKGRMAVRDHAGEETYLQRYDRLEEV